MWKSLACGPRYSCTSVKVGLVTSSSAAASKAAAIPLTSVVLPAPRSPRSSTSLGGASKSASVRPKAIVSSADLVMISRVIDLAESKLVVQACRSVDRQGTTYSDQYSESARPSRRRTNSSALHVAQRGERARFQAEQVPVHHMRQGSAQAMVVVVLKRDEAEGLQNALLGLVRRGEDFGHAVYGSRLRLKRDFDKIAL